MKKTKEKLRFNLKTKLLIILIPLSVIITVSLVIFTYGILKKSKLDNINTEMELTFTKQINVISEGIKKRLSSFDAITDSIENNGYTKEYIESLLGKYGFETGIYVLTPDKQFIQSNGYELSGILLKETGTNRHRIIQKVQQ